MIEWLPTLRVVLNVATPLPFVTAFPTEVPSTEKLTVPALTAVPPEVRVNVAWNDTGPLEPNATELGVTLLSTSVVATFVTTFTTNDPLLFL